MITCPADTPPRPPIVQRVSRNPHVTRPVLAVARKPVRRASIRTLCNLPAVPNGSKLAPLQMLPAADALSFVAMLPAVPGSLDSGPRLLDSEPLTFELPAAGPTVTRWIVPSPPWLAQAPMPYTLPVQIPVVPEPTPLSMVLLGLVCVAIAARGSKVDTI
jgi:hypothetical protein